MNATSWTISDFMTPVVCCADVDLSLSDARDRMSANKIRHLLITRGPVVVGVLSQRDIDVAEASARKREAMTIADAMHTDATPGRPVDVVLDYVREVTADALVTAASGRNQITRFVVGSTVDKLVRQSPCPVVVVPG